MIYVSRSLYGVKEGVGLRANGLVTGKTGTFPQYGSFISIIFPEYF